MKSLFMLFLVFTFPFGAFAQEKSTGSVVSIESSIAKLRKSDKHREAVAELRNVGYPAFKDLRSMAKDTGKGRDERIAAVLLAGEIVKTSTAAAVSDRDGFRKDIEAMLAGEKDEFVREASAIALGKLEDKNALKSLKSALNDKSGNVRMRAAWALAKNGDYSGKEAALDGLKSKNVTDQILAVDALEGMNDDSLIGKIRDNLKSDNVWTRINSALALNRIGIKKLTGVDRIAYLGKALKTEQEEVRQWAVGVLASDVSQNRPEKAEAQALLLKTAKESGNPAAQHSAAALVSLIDEGKINKEEIGR